MKLFLLGLFFFALTSRSHAEEEICVSETGTYTAIVDLFASQYGFFTFEECGDTVNPTIGLKIGEVYTFNQADRSNYYHPMGFAYDVDGALADSPELEPVNVPPGSASTCDEDLTCPAPIYFKDGDQLGPGLYNNLNDELVGGEDFGLDDYEPEFFYPIAEWSAPLYEIKLRFTVDDIDQDIFYFCHIHAGMTGRIKILDDDGDAIVEDDTPDLPYSYEATTGLDETCGTSGLTEFESITECPTKGFVCLDGTEDDTLEEFATCVDAMDCFMLQGMATCVEDTISDNGVIFSLQMIPHHVNAVNMAKALLKQNTENTVFDCDDLTGESEDCIFEGLVREIIVVQNFQIQGMESALIELGR